MKSFVLFACMVLASRALSQDIELDASVNTSSDIKYQNARGIGIGYHFKTQTKWQWGLGLQYSLRTSSFDNIYPSDADPRIYNFDKVHSEARRLSMRLNALKILKENESFRFALGPEISYNLLSARFSTQFADSRNFYFTSGTADKSASSIGVGILLKAEIKNIFSERFSFCLNLRPEVIFGGGNAIGVPYSTELKGMIGFTEMQLGLKYKMK